MILSVERYCVSLLFNIVYSILQSEFFRKKIIDNVIYF